MVSRKKNLSNQQNIKSSHNKQRIDTWKIRSSNSISFSKVFHVLTYFQQCNTKKSNSTLVNAFLQEYKQLSIWGSSSSKHVKFFSHFLNLLRATPFWWCCTFIFFFLYQKRNHFQNYRYRWNGRGFSPLTTYFYVRNTQYRVRGEKSYN